MSAHTPGPWKLERARIVPASRDRIFSVIANLNEGAMVWGGDDAAFTIEEMNMAEEANRRLMVAAPELLAELQNIANAKRFNKECFADDIAFADWAQSRARHTIAKAIGS